MARVVLRIGGLLDRLVRAMQVKIEAVTSLNRWSCAFIREVFKEDTGTGA